MLLSLSLFGCFAEFPNRDGTFPDAPLEDYDGDGYSEQQGDCDDRNYNLINGPWYQDADGDGYGDASTETTDCAKKDDDGYTSVAGDCNDTDASIFPGSAYLEPSLCAADADGDGYGDAAPDTTADVGTDCNDDDPAVYPGRNLEDGVLCVLDEDGDGYGAIDAPLPYQAGTDCDDAAVQINPSSPEQCDEEGKDEDCDGQVNEDGALGAPAWYPDSDQDGYGAIDAAPLLSCVSEAPAGYTSIQLDCDDGNANNAPNGEEICDGVDNNCNGQIDEDSLLIFYADVDGDGFGDPTGNTVLDCTAPSGYQAADVDGDGNNDFDCNDDGDLDGDGIPDGLLINPNASEICDGIDNNCNGDVDDNDVLVIASTGSTFYLDSDNDGYGSLATTLEACDTPVGYVSNSTDCDDANPSINPAAADVCNQIDDDCDASTVDGTAGGNIQVYVDADGDGQGDATDANGDSIPDSISEFCPTSYDTSGVAILPANYAFNFTDCDDSDPFTYLYAEEDCSSIDRDCDNNPILGAVDQLVWYSDADGDGFPSSTFTIIECPIYTDANGDGTTPDYDSNGDPMVEAPVGYMTEPSDAVFDCDDTNGLLSPGNIEVCNGIVDSCEAVTLYSLGIDEDGDGDVDRYAPPPDEADADGDGFVVCEFVRGSGDWITIPEPLGSNDCQDDDINVFPYAPELCTGEVEDCTQYVDDGNGGWIAPAVPDNETDDDGDGYVECSGFQPGGWEGDSAVVGGDDCDDNPLTGVYTYVGSAENEPTLCASDAPELPLYPEGDGDPDCVRWSNNPEQLAPLGYSCDLGIFLTDEIGPDFKYITAGTDPEGRYELTNDFYMMTTEVTQEMYEALMGNNPSYYDPSRTAFDFDYPVDAVNYENIAEFANALSNFVGLDPCYDENLSFEPKTIYSGSNFFTCPGYRLPTEAEWEYAARAGITGGSATHYHASYFWTPNGGGPCQPATSIDTPTINDGVTNPSLDEYAWSVYNNTTDTTKQVARLAPNGFGLYDLHGNVSEMTQDWRSFNNHTFPAGYDGSFVVVDPFSSNVSSGKAMRGGEYDSNYSELGVSKLGYQTAGMTARRSGFRLIRTANP